jgi:hypothetical protein
MPLKRSIAVSVALLAPTLASAQALDAASPSSSPPSSTPPSSTPPSSASSSPPPIEADDSSRATRSVSPSSAPTAEARPSGITVRAAPAPLRTAGALSIPINSLVHVPRTDPTEVLSLVPGVMLTNEVNVGDAPEVSMRGFFGNNGQDVGFTVDGVPLNEESHAVTHGYADTFFAFPLIVSRLDIVQGVADPRQGNFSVAGSIDYQLGLAQRGLTMLGSYGNIGYRRAATLFGPRAASDATFIALDVVHSDGRGARRALDRITAIAQHAFALGHGVEARLLAIGYATRWQTPGFVRQDDVDARRIDFFGTYPDSGEQGGVSARFLAAGGLEWHDGSNRAQLRAFGNVRTYSSTNNADGFYRDPVNGDLSQATYDGGMVGTNGFYRRTFRIAGEVQEFEAGFIVRHDRFTLGEQPRNVFDNAPVASMSAMTGSSAIRVTNPGGYLDATFRFRPWLALRAGVRIDAMIYDVDRAEFAPADAANTTSHVRSVGVNAGPKLSLALGPWRGVQLVASYGRGFRSPDARDVTNAEPIAFTVAETEDVTLRYQLPTVVNGPRFSASLTGFHTAVNDDQIFDPAEVDEVSVGATQRWGAVFWTRLQPVSWIDLLASAAYTYGFVTQSALDGALAAGSAIPYMPQWVARFDGAIDREVATLRGVSIRAHGAIGAGFRGPAALISNAPTAPTFLLDANAGMRFGAIGVDVSGKNLTDARWHAADYEFASNFVRGSANDPRSVPMFVAGAPLTVFGTLSLHFDL